MPGSLTDEQIDAMDAGESLDILVAEAIGMSVAKDDAGVEYMFEPGDEKIGVRWKLLKRFSSKWDDAMFAAEKFGLFGEGHYCALSKDDGWYCIHPMSELEAPGHTLNGAGLWWPGTPLVSRDTSGPLAICRAILKLSAHENGQ